MVLKTLYNVGWRYLFRHPWQSVLMVIGITLGVAVVVAVDLANVSASRAFDLSTETVSGRATHQIVAGPAGLEEGVYTRLRRSGIEAAAAPILAEYVYSPALGGRPLQLLGVDPFAEAPFRDYLGPISAAAGDEPRPAPAANVVQSFLTQPEAVLISTGQAERYGLETGVRIELEVSGQMRSVQIVGLLQPADSLSRRALDGLLLADIATVQELTGRVGRLDRIDLILPDAGREALLARIQALLPEGVRMQPVEARSGAVEQMTAAFRVNLTALSLLALVVGMFLIYNTMTFSVVQRRPLFGTLRCLGVTREEVFRLVMVEALVVGLVGAGLGVGLGLLMGQGAVRLVTQTINDLFFVVTVRGVQAPPASLLKGALLGLLATLLTAAPPAWEAASVPPRAALSRSGLESKARLAVNLAAGLGAVLLVLGGAILLIPTRSLVISFTGTFATVVGASMLAPLSTRLLMRVAIPVLGRLGGTLGRMAPRDVINSLSRTSIAVAALMVAVSVTIGVSIMVGSFRNTVVVWLEQTLQGDVYLSVPSTAANQTSVPIEPQVLAMLAGWPGVARTLTLRSVTVDSPAGPVGIAASSNPEVSTERDYLATAGPPTGLPEKMRQGGVIVSEPLANRLRLPRQGGTVTLYTDHGPHAFPVVGIYYDYSSTTGVVTMLLDTYQGWWDDPAVTAVQLRLEPGISAGEITPQLAEALAPIQRLLVRPNAELRQDVLAVFDRTFAITGALQLLATIVAFIGVLSALLSLELERQRELGILRAIGLTVRQLWGLVMIETGLLGAVAGLLAMPTGYLLAVILVYIINRRSFGWTLQMQAPPEPFLQALGVAVGAALLAGLYPAFRMGRMVTSEALRSE